MGTKSVSLNISAHRLRAILRNLNQRLKNKYHSESKYFLITWHFLESPQNHVKIGSSLSCKAARRQF